VKAASGVIAKGDEIRAAQLRLRSGDLRVEAGDREAAAPDIGAAKVGSSVARRFFIVWTRSLLHIRLLMIEASSACRTIDGSVVIIWPERDFTITTMICI